MRTENFEPIRISARVQNPAGGHEPDPWVLPDLTLLGTGRRPAPPFPLHLLGQFWSTWVERRAAGASAPVDYIGTCLLGCTAAMIANVRWPMAGASWSEPPVLWCAVVGSPSSSKSPGMDAVLDLVRHAEEQLAYGFEDEQRAHETARQTAKARREEWENEVKVAVKQGDPVRPMPEDASAPTDPVRPRVRVVDVTTEKLAHLASGLPRGMLIVRDELTGWLGSFDRYGGGGGDRAFAIESYGGRSYTVDRIKNPEPIRIAHLSVGVLGGVQPDKLPVVITGPDDGLASRILWAWPDSSPEFSLSRKAASDVPAMTAFSRLATLEMMQDEDGTQEPARIRLTTEAEDELEQFARAMAMDANEATGIYAGTLGKARGHALRLSCVLEHLWWTNTPSAPEPTSISVRAVAAAASLVVDYFLPMAARVFGDAAIPADERAAIHLIRHVKRRSLVRFNAREMRREIGGPLRQAEDMDSACKALVEAGLIREAGSRAGGSSGRKTKAFEVNPIVLRGGDEQVA